MHLNQDILDITSMPRLQLFFATESLLLPRHPWAPGQLLDLLNGAGLAVRETGEAMNFRPKMAAKWLPNGSPLKKHMFFKKHG